jgi:flagellar biosynthesis/type III secretory pathway protein FliH
VVAGDDLKPDEIRSYSQCDSSGESRARLASHEASGECHQLEYDSIDIIEFAPLFVLGAAQEKAQELIAQAEADANQIREAARQQGAAEGREEAKRGLLPSLVALSDAGQSLIVFEERLVTLYEPHLVQLALEIAEKVIGRVVGVDEQLVASVLERAKAEVTDAKQIRIFLHPDDLEVIREMRPDLVHMESGNGRTVAVFAALDVGRGGCRLETESGIIDATIPTQLDEIQRQLFDHEMVGLHSSDNAVLSPAI